MKILTDSFVINTHGKGTYEITADVESIVSKSDIKEGVVTVFVRHTSCSLIVMENADSSARTDLHAFFDELVPEDTPYFVHTYEGGDDMPSHIKMALTRSSENIPFTNARLHLGTWQGLFLWEHRVSPHTRKLTFSFQGE